MDEEQAKRDWHRVRSWDARELADVFERLDSECWVVGNEATDTINGYVARGLILAADARTLEQADPDLAAAAAVLVQARQLTATAAPVLSLNEVTVLQTTMDDVITRSLFFPPRSRQDLASALRGTLLFVTREAGAAVASQAPFEAREVSARLPLPGAIYMEEPLRLPNSELGLDHELVLHALTCTPYSASPGSGAEGWEWHRVGTQARALPAMWAGWRLGPPPTTAMEADVNNDLEAFRECLDRLHQWTNALGNLLASKQLHTEEVELTRGRAERRRVERRALPTSGLLVVVT
jgi:hypothetical protein